MIALITGASSGIGKSMSYYLADKCYDLILVSRNKKELLELSKTLKVKVRIIELDLSLSENCFKLYQLTKNENVDILINNAGFGLWGYFKDTDINTELNMIDLNVKSVHILTKLFLNDMTQRNNGYILNTSSVASFFPGPLMSTYYSTKHYVTTLTKSINYELKKTKSNVVVCALCPGPVNTGFNERANVQFSINSLSSDFVAKYAIDKMFKKKMIIIPGVITKIGVFGSRFIGNKLLSSIMYKIQKRKQR